MSKKSIFLLSTLLSSLILFSSCSVPKFMKPTKQVGGGNVNAKDRARKNVESGRGVSLGDVIKGRGGSNYEFGTSNPLWRSSLEVLDFLPLSTVDYSGGIIITDWYNDSNSSNEAIKITIRFLSNEIQSNSIKVIVHSKKCSVNENCSVRESNSKIKEELQRTILKQASLLKATQKK